MAKRLFNQDSEDIRAMSKLIAEVRLDSLLFQIRFLRETKNYTPEFMALMLQVPVDTYIGWESGSIALVLDDFFNICGLLGIEPSFIFDNRQNN